MDMDLTGSSVNSESLTALNALTPGVHEIQRRSVAEVYIETSPSDEPNVILRVPIISHSTVTVLPPGESDVTRVKNEALRPAMEAGITVSQLSERMFTVNFPNAALPADVAFGIYARQNGHEQQISHMERHRARRVERLDNRNLRLRRRVGGWTARHHLSPERDGSAEERRPHANLGRRDRVSRRDVQTREARDDVRDDDVRRDDEAG